MTFTSHNRKQYIKFYQYSILEKCFAWLAQSTSEVQVGNIPFCWDTMEYKEVKRPVKVTPPEGDKVTQ